MSLKNFQKNVGCVSPRATMFDACQEMSNRNIGAVVVISDDGKPIGLLTDRDVCLRAVAERRDLQQTTVEQIMSTGVACLPEDASIQQATELMRDRGVRRVPIVDSNGRVSGLISFDDIMLMLGMEMGNLANAIFGSLSAERQERATSPQPSA